MNHDLAPRPWMSWTLVLAGVYNLLWGSAVVVFPSRTLAGAGFDPIGYPQIWQCVGMVVGVYGIGYLIAARAPFHHWPIVLVGLLGKLFGPIGFFSGAFSGQLPLRAGWMVLFNDLIWWIPFSVILWEAFRHHQLSSTAYASGAIDHDPLRQVRSESGQSLIDLSIARPRLVVFLRHAGCTFCRETLSDLAEQRELIEGSGTGIVLVHPGEPAEFAELLDRFCLADLPTISDPQCHLFHQFGLEAGRFRQLFGGKVWLRGLGAGLLDRHGIGWPGRNVLQMPGVYLVHRGRILAGFQHESAADRIDYQSFVRQFVPSMLMPAATQSGSPDAPDNLRAGA